MGRRFAYKGLSPWQRLFLYVLIIADRDAKGRNSDFMQGGYSPAALARRQKVMAAQAKAFLGSEAAGKLAEMVK